MQGIVLFLFETFKLPNGKPLHCIEREKKVRRSFLFSKEQRMPQKLISYIFKENLPK